MARGANCKCWKALFLVDQLSVHSFKSSPHAFSLYSIKIIFLTYIRIFVNNESNIGKIIKLLVSQAIFCLLTLESFEEEESILERVAYQV